MPRKRDNLLFADDFKDVLVDMSDEEISGKTASQVRAELDRIMGRKKED